MKYRFRSLFVAMLVLTCVLSFSACGSESRVTSTSGKQNNSEDDTKPSDSINSTAGTTQGGLNHVHQFGEWTVVAEATCTEDGLQERYCDCGEKETQTIDSIGHSMVDDVCEHCGYTESEPSAGLKFTLNDDGESYSVSGIGVCTDLVIVIPSEYEGKPVTEIGSKAFYDWDVMTGVVIPGSVTKIGAKAFNGCTKLEKINLPDTITEIGEDAFNSTAYYCYSSYGYLKPGGENWKDGSLYIGKHLIKVESDVTGAYVIREGTKSIADGAFEYCSKILKVTIPDSVVAIGEDAFYRCSRLGQVTIGNAVRRIGSNAFGGCNSLTGVFISDLAGWCSINFGGYEANPLYYGKKLYLDNELIH